MARVDRDEVRTRIVEAAAQLLREQGAHAVTTRAVAQAAGAQAPTMYRLLGDKDGLLDAVAEHVMATFVATKAGATQSGKDPVADLWAGWRTYVEFGLANPELYALLHAPGRTTPSPATAAGIEVLRTRVRRLAAAGLLAVDERRAVYMIHAAGTGTVFALLEMPAADRDPGLSKAMFDAVTGICLSGARATTDTRAATVAVTLGTMLPDLPALTDAERTLMGEWLNRSVAQLRTP